jgi:hypothetical protein
LPVIKGGYQYQGTKKEVRYPSKELVDRKKTGIETGKIDPFTIFIYDGLHFPFFFFSNGFVFYIDVQFYTGPMA